MRNLIFDMNTRYQTLDNFGASACWWTDVAYEHASPEIMEKAAELLFHKKKGAGLSCVRMNIGGGSTEYDKEFIGSVATRSGCFQMKPGTEFDWSQHAGQQWLIRRAKEMGCERFIAFVNSPPAWMTVNGHCRADSDYQGTSNLRPEMAGAFAEFLTEVMRHFEEIGYPFDYISPINEPAVPWNTAKQEGCRYENKDMVPVVLALRKALDEKGVKAGILVPECNTLLHLLDEDLLDGILTRFYPERAVINDGEKTEKFGYRFGGKYNEVIKDFFVREDVRAAVSPIIAAHSYGTDTPGKLKPVRECLNENRARYPGYDFWMTEFCVLGEYGPKRDFTMAAGEYVAKTIHADLTIANASAWQWWLGITAGDYKDGLVYLDVDRETLEVTGVHDSKILWAMGHYARFLRPGSVRVGLTGGDAEDGILASGWLNQDGVPVVVLMNTTDTAEQVALYNAPAMAFRVWKTDDNVSMAAAPAIRAEKLFELPAHTFMTIKGC